jgi:hypothetical protein
MHALGEVLVGGGASPGRRDAVVGEVLWATLRGLVLSQMLTTEPVEPRRELAVLAEMLTAVIDEAG